MSEHKPITITGYTIDSMYEELADRCVEIAARAGVRVHPVPYAPRGSWHRNCSVKPRILYNQAVIFRDLGLSCPLVWIDSDASILRSDYPEFVGGVARSMGAKPLGFRYRDQKTTNEGRMLSGTVVVRSVADDDCLDALRLWRDRCDENPDHYDDWVFQEMFDGGEIDFFNIGRSLCWVDGIDVAPTGDTIVYHNRTKAKGIKEMEGVVG